MNIEACELVRTALLAYHLGGGCCNNTMIFSRDGNINLDIETQMALKTLYTMYVPISGEEIRCPNLSENKLC